MGDKAVQDFAAARTHLERLAATGNATALSYLGFIHSQGLGVPVDHPRANVYHHMAADAGEVLSEMSLAYRYYVGLQVARDCDRSARLYELAAHKGACAPAPTPHTPVPRPG